MPPEEHLQREGEKQPRCLLHSLIFRGWPLHGQVPAGLTGPLLFLLGGQNSVCLGEVGGQIMAPAQLGCHWWVGFAQTTGGVISLYIPEGQDLPHLLGAS